MVEWWQESKALALHFFVCASHVSRVINPIESNTNVFSRDNLLEELKATTSRE
jgi:hypothetical protein